MHNICEFNPLKVKKNAKKKEKNSFYLLSDGKDKALRLLKKPLKNELF